MGFGQRLFPHDKGVHKGRPYTKETLAVGATLVVALVINQCNFVGPLG